MAPSSGAPGVGPSPGPGRAEQLCTHSLCLALPQDRLTTSPLHSCKHKGWLKVFSGTPLAATKMRGFEKNGGPSILGSLEIMKRLCCRLAEWWDF